MANPVAAAVDWLGTTLHLPEMGISETLNANQYGVQPTANTYNYQAAQGNVAGPVDPRYTQTYNGINNVLGGNAGQPLVSPISPSQTTSQSIGRNLPSGQVAGASTSGGGGAQTLQQQLASRGIQSFSEANAGDILRSLQAQEAEQNRLRDEAYNQSNDYLNQAGGYAQSALDAARSSAQGNFDVNAATLGGYKQSAKDTLNQQQSKGTTAYENALADARRTFQEQQMGAQQRFGGSSSAGQAMSEIQGREQARQFGQTNRQYTDLTNQINTQHASVERDFNTQMMQLKQSRDQAIQGATQDFQNKLMQISQNRAQLSQDKANASLAALQNLRNQIFTINQQNTQFEQQLALMKQQAQLNLGNYNTAATGYGTQAANAVGNTQYQMPGTNTAATGGLGQSQQTPQYQGALGSYKNPLDPYGVQGIMGQQDKRLY
ncbi:MAG: hypothetical protein M0P59_13445 [Gallionella sp.]|jgi:hypothetical protein|nr:hypothetical protein [Gallionella sp.]